MVDEFVWILEDTLDFIAGRILAAIGRYLCGLTAWDRRLPGFEHVTEGAEVRDGTYHVLCVR